MSLSGSSEVQELGHNQVCDLVVDRCPEEDDPVLEQARVDVEGALPARVLLDHHRDQGHRTLSQRPEDTTTGASAKRGSRPPPLCAAIRATTVSDRPIILPSDPGLQLSPAPAIHLLIRVAGVPPAQATKQNAPSPGPVV